MTRCLLAGLSLAGLLSSSGAAPKATTSPAKPKYTIRHHYKVDDRLLLTQKTTGEATIRLPAQPRPGRPEGPIVRPPIQADVEGCVEVALEVRAVAKPGWKEITLRVRRIRMRMTDSREEPRALDTDRPWALKEKEQVKAIQELKNGLVKVRLNPQGQIASMKGTAKLAEVMTKVHPEFRVRDHGSKKAALEKAFAGSIGQLLLWPGTYLPPGPVSVSDTWEVKRKLHGPIPVPSPTQTMTEDTRCTLVGVRRTPAGRIATIILSGRWRDTDEDMNMTATGQVRFNIDKNALVSHRIELKADGTFKDGTGIIMKMIIVTELTKDPARPTEKPVEATTRPKQTEARKKPEQRKK